MPSANRSRSQTRLSDIVHEAKRVYIPHIRGYLSQANDSSIHPISGTYPYPSTSLLSLDHVPRDQTGPYIAIVTAIPDQIDAIDVALQWAAADRCTHGGCPVVNMAHATRAGGDWETNTGGFEESLARRSNLHVALQTRVGELVPGNEHYPIPDAGGMYTSNLVVFRGPAPNHEKWEGSDWMRMLPVISVTPMRRPKLDSSKTGYAFREEREMMKEKLRSILRIAAFHGHHDICLGAFGLGSVWRNPPKEVAEMWGELLFVDDEFVGLFQNIIFVFPKELENDMKVFQEIFNRRPWSR